MKPNESRSRAWSGSVIFSGILAFLAVIGLGSAGPAFSGDVHVVKGVVERISGRYIVLAGERYDIAGAPVTAHPGKRRSGAAIRGGDKVELSLQEGRVISLRNLGPVLQ